MRAMRAPPAVQPTAADRVAATLAADGGPLAHVPVPAREAG